METLLRCPITDQEINATTQENYIQYVLVYDDLSYNIRLSQGTEWYDQSKILPEHKIILQGMLHNNEWPIEGETIITLGLIEQIIRSGEYPRNFNEKVDYFLLKSYLEGGREYKQIIDGKKSFLSAYAQDFEEYHRIRRALISKQFIEEPSMRIEGVPSSFNFTELGITKGEELNDIKIRENDIIVGSIPGPKIKIVVAEGDNYYGQKLNDFLLKCGFTVSFIDGLNDTNGYAIVSNNRESLYNGETDYIVFIKSTKSNRTHSFGTFFDVAVEAHKTTSKRNFDYIYIANVDDLNVNARPRITDYNNTTLDFRILTNRRILVKKMLQVWKRRERLDIKSSKQKLRFKFPVVKLTEFEETWLRAVYNKFLNDQEINYRALWASIWDKSPVNFDPVRMNHSLVISGTQITLLGIWHIDPGSDIFEKYDKVIRAIKEILKSAEDIASVSSEQIQAITTGISALEIRQIFKLMYAIQFVNSYSSGLDYSSSISVNDDELYRKFRRYNSLEQHIEELFTKYDNDITTPEEKVTDESEDDSFDGTHSYKTRFAYKDKFSPVMGVASLAEDLAGIINNLQNEKGQMIGIFGKWGRGKTFLLNELWEVLRKNETPKYMKVDYHAWKYQETPASWAYLYETLATKYLDRNEKCIQAGYYWRLLWLNYKREGVWPLIRFGLTIAATVVSAVASTAAAHGWIIAPILVLGGISYLFKLTQELSPKASNLIKKYSSRRSFKDTLGMQADIQDELIVLLKTWIPKGDLQTRKIILCVEDIDRCTEERVVQNIDALRIMLEDDDISKRLIIVALIDERILKNAIKEKYASFKSAIKQDDNNKTHEDEESIDTNRLAAEYIDKAFIAAIKLGGLNINQKEEYLNELFKQEVDPKVLASAKNAMRKEFFKTESEQKAMVQENKYNVFVNQGLTADIEESKGNEFQSRSVNEESEEPTKVIQDVVNRNEESRGMAPKAETNVNPEMKEEVRRVSDQNRFEMLTEVEVIALTELVKRWTSSTPRRIRIFYYRYLLCKNLIVNKYSVEGTFNIWQNEKGIKTLMALILHYTKLHDPSMIAAKRNEIALTTTERTKISEIPESINAPVEDYLVLFEILELVIAY